MSRRAPQHALVVDGTERAAVEVAGTYGRRLRGMLARRELPDALLLVPGGSVHGVGMREALDVALLRPQGRGGDRARGPFVVVRVARLRPWGLVGSARGVRAVLESPAGRFADWRLVAGSRVELGAALPQE